MGRRIPGLSPMQLAVQAWGIIQTCICFFVCFLFYYNYYLGLESILDQVLVTLWVARYYQCPAMCVWVPGDYFLFSYSAAGGAVDMWLVFFEAACLRLANRCLWAEPKMF